MKKLMAAFAATFLLAIALATSAEAKRTSETTTQFCGFYHCGSTQPYRLKKNVRHRTKIAHKHKKKKRIADANGNKAMPWNMVKVQTVQGFYLTVHPAHASKFLKFFEILDREGVKVPKDMVGCFARGNHVRGSNHYIGVACDIQTGWNRTIPAMYHASQWIKEAGLYDGCSFGDCGHIEAIRGTHNARKLPNLYAALAKFRSEQSTAAYQP